MRHHRSAALPVCLLVFMPSATVVPIVRAHDIPNERVDRAIQIEITPGLVRIDYEVSLSELTLAQDLRQLVGPVPGADRSLLFNRYGDTTGPLNAKGFLVTIDNKELALECAGFDLYFEQHPRYVFHLRGALPKQGRLRILDTNYVSSEGTSRLALRVKDEMEVSGYEGPRSVELVEPRPLWMLSDEEEQATKQVTVSFAASHSDPLTQAAESVASSTSNSQNRTESGGSPLARLLDRASKRSWMVLWLIALGLGAGHALQPGHGKTLVAAASLGSSQGWLGSMTIALATTCAHFASVLVLAVGLWLTRSTRYAAIQLGLTHAAGFVIALIGFWKLGRHMSGFGEHAGVDLARAGTPTRTRELLVLGLAGGVVPCWDAVVLVVVAELAGALGLGLFLLTGFSLGMGAVLVGVGLTAGHARRRLTKGREFDGWERALGVISGVVLASIGVSLYFLG